MAPGFELMAFAYESTPITTRPKSDGEFLFKQTLLNISCSYHLPTYSLPTYLPSTYLLLPPYASTIYLVTPCLPTYIPSTYLLPPYLRTYHLPTFSHPPYLTSSVWRWQNKEDTKSSSSIVGAVVNCALLTILWKCRLALMGPYSLLLRLQPALLLQWRRPLLTVQKCQRELLESLQSMLLTIFIYFWGERGIPDSPKLKKIMPFVQTASFA